MGMQVRYTPIPDFENHKEFIIAVEEERERDFSGDDTDQTNTVYKGNHEGKDIFVVCTISWVKQDMAGMHFYKPFSYSFTYHNGIATIIPMLKR